MAAARGCLRNSAHDSCRVERSLPEEVRKYSLLLNLDVSRTVPGLETARKSRTQCLFSRQELHSTHPQHRTAQQQQQQQQQQEEEEQQQQQPRRQRRQQQQQQQQHQRRQEQEQQQQEQRQQLRLQQQQQRQQRKQQQQHIRQQQQQRGQQQIQQLLGQLRQPQQGHHVYSSPLQHQHQLREHRHHQRSQKPLESCREEVDEVLLCVPIDEVKDCECPICFEDLHRQDAVGTKCGHKFHKSCLTRWTENHNSCPVCRQSVFSKVGVRESCLPPAPTVTAHWEVSL